MNEKYIPLYRKYRPQKLEEIVGQEHIKKALANAINMNKIAHAYLFTGPRGTGKTSTARIFAKSLNCVNGPTVNPCGECENCVDITNSVPMDVIEIDAASNRKVEDAQNILEKVMYAPVNSRYKIYIIDEVHMLSTTAFNALLKTLEEPPENVIFILATTEVHKVLDTIKSRCQRFDFRRITTDDIVKHLRMISDKEKINITDDALFTIAKNSAGGMRDSIALLDQLSVLDGTDAITTDDINSLLGRISFDVLSELAEKIINSKQPDAIEVLEKIYNSGNEPVQILTNLLDYFKNLLIIKNCREEIITELTQLNDAQINKLKEQCKQIETHQIVFIIEKISNYIKEVKTTNNPRLWLEVGIIDLANLTENTTLLELQARISRLEGGAVQPVNVTAYKTPPAPVLKPHAATPPSTVQPAPKAQQPVKEEPSLPKEQPEQQQPQSQTTEDFTPMPKSSGLTAAGNMAAMWENLLQNIQSAPTRALLKQWANPIKIEPDSVILTMKNEVLLKQFVEGNKKKMLENAVDALFSQQNSKVIVRLPQADDVPVAPSSNPRQVTPPPQPKKTPEPQAESQPVSLEPPPEVVQEAKEEAIKIEAKTKSEMSSMYSDQVNMVVELFDGKFIET